MPLRLGAVLLATAIASPSWASNWSACPGWDQAAANEGAHGYWAFVSPYT